MVQLVQTWLQVEAEHLMWRHFAFHTHDWEHNLVEAQFMLHIPKKHFWAHAFLPEVRSKVR